MACVDVDECAKAVHTCQQYATCINTEGSFACAGCAEGWASKDGGVSCEVVSTALNQSSNSLKTYKLQASAKLGGMRIETFDQEAEKTFRAEVAALFEDKTAEHVVIRDRSEVSWRRRLLTTGVKVDYDVLDFESEADIESAATMIKGKASALLSNLQRHPHLGHLAVVLSFSAFDTEQNWDFVRLYACDASDLLTKLSCTEAQGQTCVGNCDKGCLHI